jgi:hypothetical protein
MAELGYIGPKPTQFPHGNSGLFSLKDIDELKANNEYTAAEGFIVMKYYISAGGGGGAGGSIVHGVGEHAGGMGGAGGLITATDDTSFKLGTSYTITIGAGGAGSAYAGAGYGVGTSNGTNGTDTTCTYEGGTYTAVGGGGGGGFSNWYDANFGSAGGSGGGGGPSFNYTALVGGAGTAGQGNAGGSNGDGVYAIGGGGGGYSQAGLAGTSAGRDYTGHPFAGWNTNSRGYLNGGAYPDFGGLYNQDIVGTTINPAGTGLPVNHGGIFFGQLGDDNTSQGGGGTRNGAGAAGGKGYALFVYSKNLTATVGGSLTSTTDTVGNNKYTFITNGTDTISWAVA